MKTIFLCSCLFLISLSNAISADEDNISRIDSPFSCGYSISARKSTHISGSWKIPKLHPSNKDTRCTIQIAIRSNISNNSLRETRNIIGTEHRWNSSTGTQTNVAVHYDANGGDPYIYDFPIDIHDEITADVKYLRQTTFRIRITNHTKNITSEFFSKGDRRTFTLTPSQTQWEVRPDNPLDLDALPLANFGTITFYNCFATVNEVHGPIINPMEPSTLFAITLTKPLKIRAKPSKLESGGTKFHITWNHE